jgi:tripartite-type tricarboxylate transporter receptor subunit TctC
MRPFAAILLCALCGLLAGPASAQPYPSRPIRLIAPYPPGGGVDTVSRVVAEKLALRLGQPITVDNRPGGGATIGAAELVKGAPDGYTLMLGSMVDYSIAPHIHANLGFDMRRDMTAIVEIGNGTVGLVVWPGLGVQSVQQLIELAKAKPGQISYASSGVGGLIHLNGEMFKQMTGIDIVHVPYKGTAQFLPDLMAGRVQMSVDNVLAHLPHIKSGKVRVLAVATAERSPLLPEVPTMSEAGVPGFESATNYTLFAPARPPSDIVVRLNREMNTVLQSAEIRSRLLAQGVVPSGGSVDAVQARVPREMAKWAAIISKTGLKPE